MHIITRVKQQKKQDRVNIYLDGKFAFGIDLENFIRFNLKVGQELTQEEVEEIIKKAELHKTYEKLLKFAMTRPRSEKEVRDWLKRKEVHASIHEELFKRLKHLDLIDDRKFTEWWVRQRTEFKPRGERALYSELLQKGIDKNIIADVLSEAEIDEVKIAKQLLKKNEYKWRKYKGFEKRNKISQFLARKGFNWDVIKEVLD